MLGVLSLILSDAVGGSKGGATAAGAAGAAAAAEAAAAGSGGASPGGVLEALGGGALPWAAGGLALLALVETYRMAALWGEEDLERRAYPGDRFDPLGWTKAHQESAPPGVGVWAGWLGGAPGWLAGGWWWRRRDMTKRELDDMKSRELRNGRLAM
jgi:hypothetical protein